MIMNMSIEKMLSHVYEIEGLMLVTRRLGEENTPDVITDKIKRKVKELAEMCGVTLPAAEAPAAPEAPEVPAPAEPSEQPAAQEHLPEDDYDADETWQHENGEEFKEVFTLDYEEPQHVPVEPDKVPVEDREPDDDITVEFIEAPDEEPVAAEPAAPVAPVAAPVTPEPPVTVQPPIFRPPVDTIDEPVPEPDPALLPEADEWMKDRLRISMDIPPESERGNDWLKEHQDAPRPFRLMTYSDVVPKVPVYILYFTAFPNPTTGTVEFWPDLYDYDRVVSRELQAFLLKR